MPQQIQQIIQDRYIDQRQLQALLARNFIAGTYAVKVHLSPSLSPAYTGLHLIVEDQSVDHHSPSRFDRRAYAQLAPRYAS